MNRKVIKALNTLAEVFNPIIPAFIVAGIAMGVANLIAEYAAVEESAFWALLYHVLVLVNNSFTPLLSCWIGFYTVKVSGGSPILGGMLGTLTGLSEIDDIASILNLDSILYAGSGGVIAAFLGSLILAYLEKFLRKNLPPSISLVLTPLLALLLTLIPYVFLIMPVAGFLSVFICNILESVSQSNSLFINIVVGFLSAALFLPLNVAGLQHGIMALYPIQLERYGYISLYPVFAMAGAGQVGAGLLVWLRAKRERNSQLSNLAFSASIPGLLGVAGPLIYGITLPHPRVFLASCLGAGIGGVIIKCSNIVSTGWGPSGILATVMMNSDYGAVPAMIAYLSGLLISAVSGFILCSLLLEKGDLEERKKSN